MKIAGPEEGGMPMPAEAPAVRPVNDADYRLMVDSVLDYAILLLDPEGRVLSWNAGARQMKGYEAAEVIGRHFSMFYPSDLLDVDWPQRELDAARVQGRFEDEGWRLRKDGTRFWANIVLTRLIDADGALRGYSKITRDLSERRRQEELLRTSEERFRLMVEGVKDYAIFMLDPDGVISSWNAGARLNKGYEAEEIIGQHFSVFYPRDVAESGWPAEELRRALADGRFEDEGWRVRKDGSRFWASVVITAVRDHSGRHIGFAKVTRDLTERRRISVLEEEGRRVTTFLAMLGHELRNPLAPIVSALTIMEMESIESETLRMTRDVIARQVDQMRRLIDDLLDVGRITSGKVRLDLVPLDLRDATLEAIEASEPLIRSRSHTLDVDIECPELWVRGDRTRIAQIIGNLLTNAAKYTPPGGRIAVSLREAGPNAELSVGDNGIGIPPKLLPQLFDLFVQGEQDVARSEGGLGLGLSLVQQLVALHGGDVAAYSSGHPGKGSEFIVRLPTTERPSGTDAVSRERPGAAALRSILVVDDNRDAAKTMALLLERMGYRTDVAYDGPAALEAVNTGAPDLVILDIGLPGMSGLEVARHITAQVERPPRLVAATGYGQDQDREDSAAAGFCAHLTKPLHADELAQLLDSLFGGAPDGVYRPAP